MYNVLLQLLIYIGLGLAFIEIERPMTPMMDETQQTLGISSTWQVLGPFQIGTRGMADSCMKFRIVQHF